MVPTLPTHPHVMLNHTDYETTYEGAPATRPKGIWPRAARGSPGCPRVPLARAECPQALPRPDDDKARRSQGMDGGRKKPGPSPRAAHWLRGEEAPGGKDAAKKRFPTLPTHPHVMLNHTDYETKRQATDGATPQRSTARAPTMKRKLARDRWSHRSRGPL